MKTQPFCNITIAGLSITQWGLKVPSPFCSLTINNTEADNYASWELKITVGGDSSRNVNIAAFEALLYSSAQTTGYANAAGIPVTFMLGWTTDSGDVDSYISYQGWTLKYNVQTSGVFVTYMLTGHASQILKTNMPVLNIPAVSGFVQPSAIVEGLAKGIKATDYYELDIDKCDAPTLVNHNAMTTSFTSYVRGDRTGVDDYDNFPGLLSLSKTYNSTRNATGLSEGSRYLQSYLLYGADQQLKDNLVQGLTDNTPQTSTFSFWVDEPTSTKPGVIHYKASSTIMSSQDSQVLKYGTSDSNVLSISGSYDGIAYNMTDMNFSTLGFTLDASGQTIVNPKRVVNSWASSIESVYQSANIINDINALASQFSGQFTVTIPGSVKGYSICEPVSLIIMSGNTLSPMSGIYNIKTMSHTISNTFITTLTLQRLSISSASQVATSAGIYISGSANGTRSNYTTTKNIKSTGLVDFGILYPTWRDIQQL